MTEPAWERSESEVARAVAMTVPGPWSRRPTHRRRSAAADFGKAPIHHLDFAKRADHHVGRFQVAVDHASGVGVGHRLADGLEDCEKSDSSPALGRLAIPEDFREGVCPLTSFIAK